MAEFINPFDEAQDEVLEAPAHKGGRPPLMPDEKRSWYRTVKLTEAEGEALAALSRFHGVPVASIMAQAVRVYLRSEEAQGDIEAQAELDAIMEARRAERAARKGKA